MTLWGQFGYSFSKHLQEKKRKVEVNLQLNKKRNVEVILQLIMNFLNNSFLHKLKLTFAP